MNDIFDIAELPWLRVKRNHHLWQRRQRINAMQSELARLRRENVAMLEIMRSVLDESRWSELDELLTQADSASSKDNLSRRTKAYVH